MYSSEESQNKKMIEEATIVVPRVKCNGCVKNVHKALQTLPGVEVTQTDLPNKTFHLRYASEQISLATIKDTLAIAKYPVANEPILSAVDQERV